VTLRKNHRKANGHAGTHDRTNGHAPASTARGGVLVHRDQAASDDASGASVASAAISAFAAGTDREAYAEAAPPRTNGEATGSHEEAPDGRTKVETIPPGEFPLPQNPGEFVEEIHRRIDLFEVWLGLLNSEDEKIKQRAVERLTDLRYKGAAALADESQQIIIDLPRPKRD
jgi:hypothetical protein